MKCPAEIKIGTRGSILAVAQAMEVKNRLLGAFPDELTQHQIKIIKITTTGDKIQDRHLAEIGGKGLFTKELEEALYSGEIDVAVHSIKDLPDTLPDGMIMECVLEREDPRDAFISNKVKTLNDLAQGAILGTSSVRRQSQLLRLRPDIKIVPFRGNVNTRLAKLDKGDVDATILAVAGLKRIDLQNRISSYIEPEIILPAVGQGAIGVECLATNIHILKVLEKINHKESEICIKTERSFLKEMGGSCATPIAGFAQITNEGKVHFRALTATVDGKLCHRAEYFSDIADAKETGFKAGKYLKDKA